MSNCPSIGAADTVTQCAIASGALVALVSLLDVSFHPEANCANVDKAEFKKEVRALITYFIPWRVPRILR